MSFFDALVNPDAVDVVAADALAALVHAVDAAGTTASTRVANALRNNEFDAFTGNVTTQTSGDYPVRRSYRVLEVKNGEIEFRELSETR